MKTLGILLALTLVGVGASAQAACSFPAAPEGLPDGATASKEEMVTAQQSVKDYVAAMEAYLVCLDSDLDKLGEEATDEHRLIRDKRYNSAVEVMDAAAEEFNQAVRAYKAQGQ